MLPFKMNFKRTLYVSWVGLRGAVPIVFATYPLLAGIEKANMIFNIVFFVSVTSVVIQGTTLSIVAKWLGVALPEKEKVVSDMEKFFSNHPKSAMGEFQMQDSYFAVNKRIVDLNFPKSAFIVMIKRDGEYIRPGGSTLIKGNDLLVVLADHKDELSKIDVCLQKSLKERFTPIQNQS
jgi:cell volume regulation protein A